jgi:hypothetical protein
MKRNLLWLIILSAATVSPAAQTARPVEIVIPAAAAPCLRFGAETLRAVLGTSLRSRVDLVDRPSASGSYVMIGLNGDDFLVRLPGSHAAPAAPESFRITTSPNGPVIAGSDPAGAMYGALELAEQIASADGEDPWTRIKPVEKTPFLAVRGVNQFLTVQDIDDEAKGAFWSDDFWSGYLDLLARCRYNLLDIHGPADATTLTFPNGFSFFVSLPDFPEVGVGPERAWKNMDRLRRVIRMAADRGIKVAFMNYEAPPPIGPWKTRTFGRDERWVPSGQEFLRGPRLEDYTRRAAAEFLKGLPELWMFGFRIGESGQPEDFYKKTYLAALESAPKELNLYVRTWVADPAKVRELGRSTGHKLYVEPKYNGEQLGAPYQAVLGGRDYASSGSYEDYTSAPREYSIIWQIRAHGTHRVFFWGWPEFARRTVRSCRLGDGAGFSMEPMDAYLPARDTLHNDPAVGHDFYAWMYQREWLWHMVWGRTAFDPEVSDGVFEAECGRRLGREAGPKAFRAIVETSRIVPFIYAYHSAGLDHQEFAPELETGDHSLSTAWVQRWTGDRMVPAGGDNLNFLSVPPIDRTAMADPVTYVDLYLKREPTGKMGPFEAAAYLDKAADAGETAIREAPAAGAGREFDCVRRDVEALAALGRYYADRIRSAVHLEFYLRTYAHAELAQSFRDLQKAVSHWDELARAADGHFGYIPDLIRMGVNRFRWTDEGRSLGADLDQLNRLELEYLKLPLPPRYSLTLGHVPPAKARPGKPLSLEISIGGEASNRQPKAVDLLFRNSRRTGFTRIPMMVNNPFVNGWTATIPGESVLPGEMEYYFEARPSRWAHASISAGEPIPYTIPANDNDVKSVVSHRPPGGPMRGDEITLEIEVKAAAPVRTARVFYKPMPSGFEFAPLPMEAVGRSRFRARVPLTPRGLLYYFEVIDADGNGVNFPDFMERTPYFVIESWDPGSKAPGS